MTFNTKEAIARGYEKLKDAQAKLDECQILLGRKARSINWGGEYEKYVEPLNKQQLDEKLDACVKALDDSKNAFDMFKKFNWLGLKPCLKLRDDKEAYLNEDLRPSSPNRPISDEEGYKLMDSFSLICEGVIDAHKTSFEMCPIALDNAAILKHEYHRKYLDEFANDSLNAALKERAVESLCLKFPLQRDYPFYEKNGNHALTLRVTVHEKPDSSGRIGFVSVLEMRDAESFEELWKESTDEWRMKMIHKFLPDFTDVEIYLFDLTNENFFEKPQKIKEHDLFRNALKQKSDLVQEVISKNKVGKERGKHECAWVATRLSAEDLLRKQEEWSEHIEKLPTMAEAYAYSRTFHQDISTEQDKGKLDLLGREELLGMHGSGFQTWVENNLSPATTQGSGILDPMLQSQIYRIIKKFRPDIVASGYVRLVETKIREYELYLKTTPPDERLTHQQYFGYMDAFLESLPEVRDSMTDTHRGLVDQYLEESKNLEKEVKFISKDYDPYADEESMW